MKGTSTFEDISPFGPPKDKRRFGGTYNHRLQGRRISQARNQREAGSKQTTCSSKTSVDIQRTTRRYNREDITLGNQKRFCVVLLR
jgi:hypothetical protein